MNSLLLRTTALYTPSRTKLFYAAMLLSAFFTCAATAQVATIKVDASRVENHVSPRMYASFVEMMAEDVKWGLTAEMIHDRSFEGPVDYLGLPAAWSQEPDTRNDNGGAIAFTATSDEAYPRVNAATARVEHSLRVTVAQRDINDARCGFSQGHLSIRKGVAYNGYLWAKLPQANAYRGQISVALEEDNTDGLTYAKSTLETVHGDWGKYSFRLNSNSTDRFAKLSILFHGSGVLYIDQVSLEPEDAQGQVRADSEEMIRALHPSFMRWPGGNVAQDYHWAWGIGPRDLRPTWVNTAWANAPEPGDLGTDEYLALCNRLHIEPSITVNVNGAGATPEEAAAWVEYVNGPATSKYGAMRAANGHPEPYGVRQWELGNEIFGSWVRGHVSAEQYARSAVVYAKAMRAIDPSLRLTAVGEGVAADGAAWNSAVLEVAGPYIQFLAIHDYNSSAQNASAPSPRAEMFARAAEFESNYQQIANLIRQKAPGRDIRLIVNEWNLFYGADVIESMEGAVYASRMMNGFERDGNIVEANSISDLLNGWVGGVIQASRDRVYGTPQYYAVKMYSDHVGSDRLKADISSPDLAAGVPVLDAVATREKDGARIFIKMSNAHEDSALPVRITVNAFKHDKNAVLELLTAHDSHQQNTFREPLLVHSVRKSVTCDMDCTLDLPSDSVAILTLTRSHE